MKKEIYLAKDGYKMNFEIFYPDAKIPEPPLVVFLHGAGERGEKIDHLARHALPKLLEEGAEYPTVILVPQCPENCVWDNIVFDVKTLIDFTVAKFNCDKSRVYVTGGSMGGFGTWAMGQAFPNFFAAIAPVAAGGAPWRCRNLTSTPVFAYHGEFDGEIPLICNEIMVNATNKFGGQATLTVVKGFGHNDGIDTAYEKYGVIETLLKEKRTDFTPVPEAFSKYFN